MTREEVQKELQAWASSRPNDPAVFDSFREKCLKDIAAHTNRAANVYASDFLNPKFPPQAGNIGQLVLIHPKDIPAFRDLVDTVAGDEADLIIESPGWLCGNRRVDRRLLAFPVQTCPGNRTWNGQERSNYPGDGVRADFT